MSNTQHVLIGIVLSSLVFTMIPIAMCDDETEFNKLKEPQIPINILEPIAVLIIGCIFAITVFYFMIKYGYITFAKGDNDVKR